MSVRDVLRAVASYPSHDALLRDYPDLELADIEQVLAFAAAMADEEEHFWPSAAAADGA